MDGPAPSGSARARLCDPAHRDQDGPLWRRGRFEERVRRQWNAVPSAALAAAGEEVAAVAAAVHGAVGGDLADIQARVAELQALDGAAAPPAPDPLVRPGAAE